MNKKTTIGLSFIAIGFIFLLLSFIPSLPVAAWAILLGVSILCNIIGTIVLTISLYTIQKNNKKNDNSLY